MDDFSIFSCMIAFCPARCVTAKTTWEHSSATETSGKWVMSLLIKSTRCARGRREEAGTSAFGPITCQDWASATQKQRHALVAVAQRFCSGMRSSNVGHTRHWQGHPTIPAPVRHWPKLSVSQVTRRSHVKSGYHKSRPNTRLGQTLAQSPKYNAREAPAIPASPASSRRRPRARTRDGHSNQATRA